VLSDELMPVTTTHYFIGLIRPNYKLGPKRQAITIETTLYRRFVLYNNLLLHEIRL